MRTNELTPERARALAWSAAMDAAERRKRAGGRAAWDEGDRDAFVTEFNRLWPEERDREMAAAAAGQAI